MIYIPYEIRRDFNIIDEVCSALEIERYPSSSSVKFSNASIGGFAARWTLNASSFGRVSGFMAMNVATILERRNPSLKRQDPEGFDAKALRDYYSAANEAALKTMPRFFEAYKKAQARQ